MNTNYTGGVTSNWTVCRVTKHIFGSVMVLIDSQLMRLIKSDL